MLINLDKLDVRIVSWPTTKTRSRFLRQVFNVNSILTASATGALSNIRAFMATSGELNTALPPLGQEIVSEFEGSEPGRHEAIISSGYTEHLALGNCLGDEWPKPSLFYCRRLDIASGDVVAFFADAIPAGMVKFFVGRRHEPEEYWFLSLNPLYAIVVPRGMLRHIEKIDFLKPKGMSLRNAPRNAGCLSIAMAGGFQTSVSVVALPHAQTIHTAQAAAAAEVRRRANELPRWSLLAYLS